MRWVFVSRFLYVPVPKVQQDDLDCLHLPTLGSLARLFYFCRLATVKSWNPQASSPHCLFPSQASVHAPQHRWGFAQGETLSSQGSPCLGRDAKAARGMCTALQAGMSLRTAMRRVRQDRGRDGDSPPTNSSPEQFPRPLVGGVWVKRQTEKVVGVHAASPETRKRCGRSGICSLGKQASACCPCLGSCQVPRLASQPRVRVLGACDCGCPRRVSLPFWGRLAREDEALSENLGRPR